MLCLLPFLLWVVTEPILKTAFLYFLASQLQKDPMADFAFRISGDFFKNFSQYKRETGFVRAVAEAFYFEYISF